MQLPVCFGMTPLADGYDKTAAKIIQDRFFTSTGFAYSDVTHSTIQDAAALGVASELGHDRDPCEMHQDGKIAKRAVADLTRSKDGVVIDPFPECQELLKKLHKLGVHFSFSTRFQTMILMLKSNPGLRSPTIRIAVDLNTTRVSARLNLIYSALRMHKLLLVYAAVNPNSPVAKVTSADYCVLAQLEAIMRTSATCAVLDQSEKYFVKAIGFPLHMRMLEQLRAETLSVIDLSAVTESPHLVRRDMAVTQLTGIALEARLRATREAERRHCGSKTEEITGAHVVMSASAELATLLDPRTASCMHLPEDARDEFCERMVEKLKEHYVEYGMNADQYWKAKASSSAAVPPPVAVIEPEPGGQPRPPPPPAARPNAFGFVKARQADGSAPAPAPPLLDPAVVRAAARRAELAKLRSDLEQHFDIVFTNYVLYCSDINWPETFPELELPSDGDFDLLDDLIEADITIILDAMIRSDPDRATFGYLPYMATGSKASCGSFLASSYAERVNSAANLILTKGNTLLADDEVDMCVVLRMNRAFMAYMRRYFGKISRQQFRMTVVSGASNTPPSAGAPASLSQKRKPAAATAAASAAVLPTTPDIRAHFAPAARPVGNADASPPPDSC